MSRIFTAYRGVSWTEARDVLDEQRYFRDERVNFGNPRFGANAVFGAGIYFIDDYEVAGQYAFCHGVHENDDGTVLTQVLTFQHPLILNESYSEHDLRSDVLSWRLGTEKISELGNQYGIALAESIRQYVLHCRYDGIIYQLPNGSLYFICYFPERQVSHIQIDFEFRLDEALYKSFDEIRAGHRRFVK